MIADGQYQEGDPVKTYLHAQSGWHIVDIKDLWSGDRDDWRKGQGNACPGMAVAKLDDAGRESYAVALLQNHGSKYLEKVVVLRPEDSNLTMVPATKLNIIHVIWRVLPNTYKDFYTGRRTKIRHDGIAFEQIGANVMVYYLAGQKFKSVLISD